MTVTSVVVEEIFNSTSERPGLAGLQRQFARPRLQTLRPGGQIVPAGLQRRKHIQPRVVRGGLVTDAGIGMKRGDGGARNHGAARVLNQASQTGRAGLGHGGARERQERDEENGNFALFLPERNHCNRFLGGRLRSCRRMRPVCGCKGLW